MALRVATQQSFVITSTIEYAAYFDMSRRQDRVCDNDTTLEADNINACAEIITPMASLRERENRIAALANAPNVIDGNLGAC